MDLFCINILYVFIYEYDRFKSEQYRFEYRYYNTI